MTYLHFVTLNTGQVSRITPPDAVATHTAAMDLARALRDGRAPITDHSGYEVIALTIGQALLCTIFRDAGLPLATIGVAARSRGAEKLWRMMHETSDVYALATGVDDLPPAPWCAVRVEPSMMADPGTPWRWLAEYEIEIATAWIERRHRDA